MSDRNNKVIEVINHYQDALNRYVTRAEEHKILHCLDKLRGLPITVSHLEETGVGRTVNSLRKVDGEVGEGARTLVNQWKEMVEQDTHDNDDRESDKDEEKMEECTENEENSSQNDIETVNLNSSGDKKSNKKDNSKEVNGEGKSSRHKEKDKYEKKHSESSKKKHDDNSSSNNNKDNSKSSKRKYEESPSKTVEEKSESSDDSDHRKKRKSEKKYRDTSPKSSNKKCVESENKQTNSSKEKSDRHKDKKDKKDKRHEKEIVESPKPKENDHSRKKDKKDSSSKKSSSNKEEKRKSDKEDITKKSNESPKKDKQHSPTKSKSSSKTSITNDTKIIKNKLKNVDSIDSGSGASFAEALGMLEPLPTKSAKKKLANIKNEVKNPEPSTSNSKPKSTEITKAKHNLKADYDDDDDDYLSDENEFLLDDKIDISDVPALLSNPPKFEPLEINISSLLPAITPNYRPVANNPLLNENPRHKALTEYETLSNVITSKNARTKVYSGNKVAFGKIPSLFELCIRILMDHIDALEYTGGVPYMILKPILDKCTADQLMVLEHFNPYLIEDTDGLWNFHCQKEFRNKKREEWESWREMYIRCVDEREVKLRALTANIKQSQDKSLPVRQTKLAYVDSVAKPPRGVARRQQKNGYTPDRNSPLITPSSRLSAIAQSGSAGQVSVPNPGPRAAIGASSNAIMKIKKAPLMQKTLQLMKGRFRR